MLIFSIKGGSKELYCEKEYLGIALTLMNTSESFQKQCLKSKPFSIYTSTFLEFHGETDSYLKKYFDI